jgi:hypothetical protein
MAISPKNRYNANQIDASDTSGYPEGKAKNISGLGNTDGTPWEEDLTNDIFGFQQAILAAGGNVVPSGVPDKVGASQYMDAIRTALQGGVPLAFRDGLVTQFTIPDWVTPTSKIHIQGVAGGGGGGGCRHNGTAAAATAAGGGGGSGRMFDYEFSGSDLPPGTVLDFVVGQGGAGGNGGTQSIAATNGTPGDNTTLTIASLGLTLTALGGLAGAQGVISGGTPSSGGGGSGWCGGGGGSSKNSQASGGSSYPYDTPREGLGGEPGWQETFAGNNGEGGNAGTEFISVAPGNQLIRSRLRYFGQGSDGGSWIDFSGGTKWGCGGGGGGAGPSNIWIPYDFALDSYNGYNLPDNSPPSEYWDAVGKRGYGPGGGGGGGGTWFIPSNFVAYGGGKGASGMLYIKFS